MEQKPKRKNKQGLSRFQKMGIGIVGLLSLICIGVFAFGIWATSLWSDTGIVADGQEAEELIENILDMSIPDSAQEIHVAYLAWLDFVVKMRFSLTPTDVELWLSDNSCFDDLASMDASTISYSFPKIDTFPHVDWWYPEKAEQHLIDECGESPYFTIIIDQTNSDMWIIYISGFSV